MRYRVLCEGVPLAELADPATTGLLVGFGIDPVVAVAPEDQVDALADALIRLSASGLSVAVAPLAASGAGLTGDARRARARIDDFLTFAAERGARIDGVVVSLERRRHVRPDRPRRSTPEGLRRALNVAWAQDRARRSVPNDGAAREWRALTSDLHGRGLEVSALFPGWMVPDLDRGGAELASLAGDESSWLGWDRVVTRVSSPALRRLGLLGPMGPAAVGALAATARRRLGAAAGVVLGPVGSGLTGLDPMLATPRALKTDAAVTRGAGIDEVWLDGLAAVLRRGRPEDWLSSLVEAPSRPGPRWARASIEGLLRLVERWTRG